MNRIAYLTWAALGAVLVASGPAWAQAYRYSPYGYAYDYGYPNNYAYGYGSPYNYAAAAATAPLVTGRSVATGQMGMTCSTPIKACELYHASWVGNGCSCRVPGGRARGAVTAPLAAAPPIAAAATAPLMTGRSVATAGNYCTTPAKTCLLYHSSWVGNGCSCRMPGGRERGSVTPQ
jgi:hypothetical protein